MNLLHTPLPPFQYGVGSTVEIKQVGSLFFVTCAPVMIFPTSKLQIGTSTNDLISPICTSP